MGKKLNNTQPTEIATTEPVIKKNWQKAVRTAMWKSADRETNKKSAADNPAFAYRWEHVRAVVKTAKKLAKLTNADPDVLEAAAWLHDVAKKAGDQHPQEGAKFALKFLPKTDFPEEKIAHVAMVIEDHMGLWRKEPLTDLESQVLWDADKLTKIGVLAAVHWISGDVTRNRIRKTEDVIKRMKSARWRSKTVASMHTEPAQRAAFHRFVAFDAMFEALQTEWNVKDVNGGVEQLDSDIFEREAL
jgi:uncharacterized protein